MPVIITKGGSSKVLSHKPAAVVAATKPATKSLPKMALKMANSGKLKPGVVKSVLKHAGSNSATMTLLVPNLQTIPKSAKAPKVSATVQVTAQDGTQSEVSLSDLTVEELIDVYGTLDDEVNALKMNPLFVRLNEVKDEVEKRVISTVPPAECVAITGKNWIMEVGAATKAAPKITDIQTAASFMGAEAFWACAKITLADLKKYLNPDQLKQVLDENTGYIDKRKTTLTYRG